MAPPDNGEQYVILLPTVLPTWRYFPAQAERTEGQILTEKSTETDTYEENLQFPQPGGTSLPRLGEQKDKHRQIKAQKQIQKLKLFPQPGGTSPAQVEGTEDCCFT